LSRRAQAHEEKPGGADRTAIRLGLLGLLLLSACSGGLGFREPEIDTTLKTASVASEPPLAAAVDEAASVSDIATIRNAVTSADIDALKGQSIAWANSDTGARGAITGLSEYSEQGTLCRRFETTRESYDGVALFKGDACLAGQGAWRMRAFDAF
jgi:surface antigen